ncbi:MAG: adenylate kinase [Chlamydiales bacterium]|jgi:adenylate kinase
MTNNGRSGEELLLPDNTKYRSILIFGPPGAGKGTLGSFLSSAGSQFHLSSGDIFRGLSPESPAGKLYYKYASKGLLVPDEVTIEIWRNYVSGLIATNRYFPKQQYLLLDGIPRTLSQAEILDEYIDVKHIVVLKMENEKELITRMQRRASIEGRADDFDINVLRTRFEVYHRETEQVLSHYSPDKISTFSAGQKPLEVLRDVLVKLSEMLTFQTDPITLNKADSYTDPRA